MNWFFALKRLSACCVLTCGLGLCLPLAQAADPLPPNSTVDEQMGPAAGAGDIHERAIKQYPGGGLCGPGEGGMGTSCSCDNYADCQRLAGICGSSCPAGSHACRCSPQRAGMQQQMKQQFMPGQAGVIQRRGIEDEAPESK